MQVKKEINLKKFINSLTSFFSCSFSLFLFLCKLELSCFKNLFKYILLILLDIEKQKLFSSFFSLESKEDKIKFTCSFKIFLSSFVFGYFSSVDLICIKFGPKLHMDILERGILLSKQVIRPFKSVYLLSVILNSFILYSIN